VDAIVGRVLVIAKAVYRELRKQSECRRFAHGAAEALTVGRGHIGVTGYRHRSDYADGAGQPRHDCTGLALELPYRRGPDSQQGIEIPAVGRTPDGRATGCGHAP